MRIHSYLQTATALLEDYKGDVPFAAWLKNYFAQHKKYGSKDRKHIAHLCYSFFRLGKSFRETMVQERILISLFLTGDVSNPYLEALKQDWNEQVMLSEQEKLAFLNAAPELYHIFPWQEELSKAIEFESFALSFLQQPDLYLRLRPGKEGRVVQKLKEAGIPVEHKANNCLALSNSTRIEHIIDIDAEAVVQDYSSQQVLNPLREAVADRSKRLTVWDCCAASGGKSLLVYDLFPKVDLTVSDIRKSILHNLETRFRRAGINEYKSFVADVSLPHFAHKQQYDVVLCDAPCSGAGTWSRTPEQLYFFEKEKIDHYAALQQKIAVNVSKSVKKGGYFVYITCSVFTKENEGVVAYIQEHTSLQLQAMHYYKGYTAKADTLFAALFQAL